MLYLSFVSGSGHTGMYFNGILIVKVVPSPSILSALMVPLCMRIALLVSGNPNPVAPISLEGDLSTGKILS